VGQVNSNYSRVSAGLSTCRVSAGSTEYCRVSAGLTNEYYRVTAGFQVGAESLPSTTTTAQSVQSKHSALGVKCRVNAILCKVSFSDTTLSC
jgi:hypothetical protein